MTLTISDRRKIAARAAYDSDFRSDLERDPATAISAVTGRSIKGDTIELVHETTDWCFVIPAVIDEDLPEAYDLRSTVENDMYALLRDHPDTVSEAKRDPKTFLAEKFGIDFGDSGVRICHEAAGANVIIISNPATGEELSDEMLDLVSAGGPSPAQAPPAESAGRPG